MRQTRLVTKRTRLTQTSNCHLLLLTMMKMQLWLSLFLTIAAVTSAADHDKQDHGNLRHALLKNFHHRSNQTMCERIHPEELPEECWCRDLGSLGLVIECDKHFENELLNDTIGMVITIDPCNAEGSSVSLDISEQKHHIDYEIAGLRAGEEKNIPIPGWSIIVPSVGHVGVDAAVLIYGNPDSLTLKIGLNACVALASKQVCASSIPILNRVLPWYVLSGTYSFGDICGNSTNTKIDLVTATE